MATLDKQFDYYLSKEEEFLKNCYGKFLVINDKLEVVVMDTIGDAYKLGCLAYGLGNFLLQECIERRPILVRGGVHSFQDDRKFVKTENGYRVERVKKEGLNNEGDCVRI